MNKQTENRLVNSFANSFQPIFNGNLWEWAQNNVTLPPAYSISGPFNVQISPYLKKPLEDMSDDRIRQLNLACSTQTFKSGCQEILVPYIILQNPSPVLRVYQTQAAASDNMLTRIIPILKLNKDTSKLIEGARYNAKTGLFNLDNMFIKAVGCSESNLHSLSIKYAICEEVWLYEYDEIINKIKARLTAFQKNYKLILTSQPDKEGSQLHREYIKGNVYEWGWTCPDCKKLQTFEFEGKDKETGKYFGLIWIKNKDLTYDQRTNDTILTCRYCFHGVKDTDENRTQLVQQGDYIQIQSGDPTIHSYSWPAYANKDITFKSIAMRYLQAKTIYKNTGIDNDLILFRNQVLGRFWKIGEQIDTPKLLQDFTVGTEEWKDETHRFLTIDVQQDHMYWLITAWSNKVSEARLIDWGICAGFDELVNIKKQFKIKPTCIGIDSGDDTKPIYKESIIRGEWYEKKDKTKIWAPFICLKGDGGKITPRIDYPHPDNSKRYYGVETRPDPQWQAGSKFARFRARLYMWSNFSIKTILNNMIAGRLPFKFSFNHRADETFTSHMYSEYLNPKTGRYEVKSSTTPNHLYDCMCEALVLALMAKCFIPNASITDDIAAKSAKDSFVELNKKELTDNKETVV